MTRLQDVLEPYVRDGSVPGAVGLVAHAESVTVAAVGSVDVEGSAQMARESIFRVASITKLGVDDPVGKWLPELDSPVVVRTPAGPVDGVVPASRPITVLDLLTSRAHVRLLALCDASSKLG